MLLLERRKNYFIDSSKLSQTQTQSKSKVLIRRVKARHDCSANSLSKNDLLGTLPLALVFSLQPVTEVSSLNRGTTGTLYWLHGPLFP